MFIDRLLNQGSAPLLEQWLNFTDERERLIANDVANASTPGYVQQDLSVEKFQAMLRDHVDQRDHAAPGEVDFSDVQAQVESPRGGVLFHDGNNRSMEQLMSDTSKNGLMHSLAVELLRRQYATLELALKDHLG